MRQGLTRFFIFVMSLSCALAGASESDDRRAADELRSAASRVRDAANSVRSEASKVRSAAQDARSAASSAASRARGMDGEISTLKSQASHYQSEASSFRAQAQRDDQARAQVEVEIRSNTAKLSELVKTVYNLQAQVKFKESERDDLKILKQKFDELSNSFIQLITLQNQGQKELDAAMQGHLRWMEQLDKVTAELAPPFPDLKTADEVKVAAFKMQRFAQQAPKPEEPRAAELILVKRQQEIAVLTMKIQELVREISFSKGIANVHAYTPARFEGDFWRQVDEAIHQNSEFAKQVDTLVDLYYERRSYLVKIIPVLWERMLNVRLDTIHLEKAVRVGESGIDGSRLPAIITKAMDLDIQLSRATVRFYRFYSPMMSIEMVDAALKMGNELVGELRRMNANDSVGTVIEVVNGKLLRLRNFRLHVEREYQKRGTEFLRRRETFAQGSSSVKAECRALKEKILESRQDLAGEKLFASFLEACQ